MALRQGLDLFAAVRPARSLPGVPTRHHDVNLVVIRENTEDLYRGIEFARGAPDATALRRKLHELGGFEIPEDAGITLKPISLSGARRIVRFAFEYVRANRRRKVTVGHKANVMRYSDGIFLETARTDAGDYPDVAWEDVHIDTLSAQLVRSPQDFDVLLLPNLYGDILSDLCARERGAPRRRHLVAVAILGTPTEIRRELSAAGFAVVAAAPCSQRLQAVRGGEPELGADGRVVGRPVREEVPRMDAGEVEEPPHHAIVRPRATRGRRTSRGCLRQPRGVSPARPR